MCVLCIVGRVSGYVSDAILLVFKGVVVGGRVDDVVITHGVVLGSSHAR